VGRRNGLDKLGYVMQTVSMSDAVLVVNRENSLNSTSTPANPTISMPVGDDITSSSHHHALPLTVPSSPRTTHHRTY
jgi:hypothetical protein